MGGRITKVEYLNEDLKLVEIKDEGLQGWPSGCRNNDTIALNVHYSSALPQGVQFYIERMEIHIRY
jgi:hypothetical protein